MRANLTLGKLALLTTIFMLSYFIIDIWFAMNIVIAILLSDFVKLIIADWAVKRFPDDLIESTFNRPNIRAWAAPAMASHTVLFLAMLLTQSLWLMLVFMLVAIVVYSSIIAYEIFYRKLKFGAAFLGQTGRRRYKQCLK